MHLIDIPFKWGGWGYPIGGLDCVGLADHVRRSYGAVGFDRNKLAWIYELYSTVNDAPANLISILASFYAEVRETPSHLDLVLVRSPRGVICLSTYLEGGKSGFRGNKLVMTNDRSFLLPFEKAVERGMIQAIVFPSGLLATENADSRIRGLNNRPKRLSKHGTLPEVRA